MDKKNILIGLCIMLLLVTFVLAVVPDQPVLNSPTNDTVVYDNWANLNITVSDGDSGFLNVSFYGGDSIEDILSKIDYVNSTYYAVDVFADDGPSEGLWGSDVYVDILSGKWRVYCNKYSQEENRARVLYKLVYGLVDEDTDLNGFTNVSNIQTSLSEDVNKYFKYSVGTILYNEAGGEQEGTYKYAWNLNDTVDSTEFWYYHRVNGNGVSTINKYLSKIESPSGTVISTREGISGDWNEDTWLSATPISSKEEIEYSLDSGTYDIYVNSYTRFIIISDSIIGNGSGTLVTGSAPDTYSVIDSSNFQFDNIYIKDFFDATNITNNSYANYTWTDLEGGEYYWFATITDGTDTTTSPFYSFIFYDYNYTVNHTSPVLETTSQTFTLNITRDSDYITDANATLHWNGTDYTPTETSNGSYFYYTKTLTLPSVSANTNITFNWTYSLVGNENITNRTDTHTQLIYNIDMDDCSTYNITALNFTLVEESNNASINGSMDFTFSLVQEGTTVAYSKSVTNRNWTAFCIPTGEVSFTAQLQSEYTATGYDAHTYFAYNLAITNTSQDIVYYLTNGTSIVEFTVVDQSGNDIEDAYIKVMKYDIGTGVYKTIEVLKTDELGKALGNIVLDTEWYKFMVEYNGVTYLDTSATKMTSTTRTFTINLLSDFFDRYTDVVYNIYSTLNYTEATGNFAFTYSDPNGNYHQGCLRVERMAAYGNTLINETCVSSTAATILVNVNNSGPVNGTYVAVGYILFDDKYVLQTLTETWGHLSDKFGIEGLFYAFFIIITVVMVGIFNPKLAIILGMLGLIVSNILGFMFIELGWLVGIIFAAALTIYRMRDN